MYFLLVPLKDLTPFFVSFHGNNLFLNQGVALMGRGHLWGWQCLITDNTPFMGEMLPDDSENWLCVRLCPSRGLSAKS